jgi:hypothetical protein
MSKFAHLKKLDVAGKTAWLTLDDLEGNPQICLRYAGQSNHGYFNAILKRSGSRNRKLLTGKVDVQMMEDNASDDRDLFPLHVITGWKDMTDEKGKAVAFSRKECAEFCADVPDWIFEKIRNFASTPERFLPDGEELAPDGEELAKN